MAVHPFSTGEQLCLLEIPKLADIGPRLAVSLTFDIARRSSGSAAGQAAFARLISRVVGIIAGLITYPVFKAITGRIGEVRPTMWPMAALSISFYVSLPSARCCNVVGNRDHLRSGLAAAFGILVLQGGGMSNFLSLQVGLFC